ncbi:MAG: hypothetical protein LC792_17785, partial [Actinobacteria bacterium]|nr:hypothetical protein [Actinomycetota bacterium]
MIRRALVAAMVVGLMQAVIPPSGGAAASAPGAAAPAGAADAAPAAAAAPKPRVLTLAGQTPFARPDEVMQLALDLAGSPIGLEVQAVVHRAVTSRTEFTQSLGGKVLGAVEGRLSVPAPDLTTKENGQRVLSVGVQGPASAAAPPDASRIIPGRSGIYPTEVELRRGDTVVDRFVTPLVVVAAGLSPLTMAWVWRFDATPAHQPDGTVRKTAAKAFEPGGRLVRTAQAAAAAGDVHLTLAPTPETLTAWQEAAHQDEHQPGGVPADGATAGLTALKNAATGAGHQILQSPFVPFDMAGLLEGNLPGEVDAEFARGAAEQQQVLGPVPAGGAILSPGTLDSSGLGRLRQYGAERIVFPPDDLAPREQRLTPGHPFVVGSKGKPYPAAVSDPDLARLLDGDDAPALRAARFLAGLSLVALEAPGEPRGVVVVTSDE